MRAPVEAVIALSVVWVAREAYLREKPPSGEKVTSRGSGHWMIASSFGLLHGFGFAGALAEVGLPDDHTPLALASFNLGVEIGQLLFIGCLWLAVRLCPAALHHRSLWFQRGAAALIGCAAAFWVFERSFNL